MSAELEQHALELLERMMREHSGGWSIGLYVFSVAEQCPICRHLHKPAQVTHSFMRTEGHVSIHFKICDRCHVPQVSMHRVAGGGYSPRRHTRRKVTSV